MPPLLVKIRSKDRAACDRAILGLSLLGLQIVGRYLAVMGSDHLSDDLAGAAFAGIVDAIDRVAKGEAKMLHDNLRGFVVSNIHGFIADEINRQAVVRVPRSTQSAKRRAGEKIVKPTQVDFDDPAIEQRGSTPSCASEVEIKDLLEHVIESDQEQKILSLRQEGKTDEEIADDLGLSKTTVFVIRRGLENRFLELFYA